MSNPVFADAVIATPNVPEPRLVGDVAETYDEPVADPVYEQLQLFEVTL